MSLYVIVKYDATKGKWFVDDDSTCGGLLRKDEDRPIAVELKVESFRLCPDAERLNQRLNKAFDAFKIAFKRKVEQEDWAEAERLISDLTDLINNDPQ